MVLPVTLYQDHGMQVQKPLLKPIPKLKLVLQGQLEDILIQ